ncbi:MAG: hypothetical protein WB502_05700 [Thermoactinomyces sp.]
MKASNPVALPGIPVTVSKLDPIDKKSGEGVVPPALGAACLRNRLFPFYKK